LGWVLGGSGWLGFYATAAPKAEAEAESRKPKAESRPKPKAESPEPPSCPALSHLLATLGVEEGHMMNRIEGTSAHQLDLIDEDRDLTGARPAPRRVEARMRLLQKDLYAELARRRRRAQIAARHALDADRS
jgi:hypothetical protein